MAPHSDGAGGTVRPIVAWEPADQPAALLVAPECGFRDVAYRCPCVGLPAGPGATLAAMFDPHSPMTNAACVERGFLPRVLLTLLALLSAGLVGCATPARLTLGTVNDVYGEIRRECPPSYAGSTDDASDPAPRTVQDLVVSLRAVLERLPEDQRGAVFDTLPQGLRAVSGVRRERAEFLRDGILTTHAFVNDALVPDYSFGDLSRYVTNLERLATNDPGTIDSAPLTALGNAEVAALGVNPEKKLIWHRFEPESLYEDIHSVIRDPTSIDPITVASVFLPYKTTGGEERGASFSFYVQGGSRVLGFDVLDTKGTGHDMGSSRKPSVVAAPFHYAWRGLSWLADHTFQARIPGLDVPYAYPLNIVVHVPVQIGIAAKESVFEILKMPLAAGSSLIARDRSMKRLGNSFLQPLRNTGSIWTYHGAQIRDYHGMPSIGQSILNLLQTTPLLGSYRPVYFDDPWTQFAESAPQRKFTAGPEESTPGPDELHVFLTRGIHGRGPDEQGNEMWLSYIESMADESRGFLQAFGIEQDSLKVTVEDVPYAWGTVFDPIFSMMNLSSGYSYTMARGIEKRVGPRAGEQHVVSILGHSGGVQRMTMASRLLWSRDIATETLYGVAGPSIAHAPTKPRQTWITLSKSEFQDADFTSQFSAMVSTLESLFLKLYELPGVGFLWHLSAWSRGYPGTHKDAQITRTEGGQSTLHRNPGMAVPKRRDLSLSFFRDDVFSVLLEKFFLRHAREELSRRGELSRSPSELREGSAD